MEFAHTAHKAQLPEMEEPAINLPQFSLHVAQDNTELPITNACYAHLIQAYQLMEDRA